MATMADTERQVVLQVDVRESTRTRLKLLAVRQGVTMGQLADQLLDKGMKSLEQSN